MKTPPAWKFWLSHLAEVPVESVSTPHNPGLHVVLHRGRYKLITHGAIYSYSDLYTNFRRTFEQLDWPNLSVSTCLILGLGLGSIPDMLTVRFKRKIRFTAVEIDEEVSRLAFQYVLQPKHIPVEVFTADAVSFLEWHRGRYDMICSDVFIGDVIPKGLQTIEALEALRGMLKPGGILLYNRLSRYQPDVDLNIRFRDEVFLQVFPEGGFLDVDGNWMFISRMAALRQPG